MSLIASYKKLKLPPRTALEAFEMLPEGTLAEVIDNIIYMPLHPLLNTKMRLVICIHRSILM